MIAGILVLQSLGACGFGPVACEEPVAGRVFIGTLTLGLTELERAIVCPNEAELNAMKARAKEGDPDAQLELSRYYQFRISNWHFDYHDRAERAAARLRRCAAEGGSHSVRIRLGLNDYLAEADGPAFVYKHSRIAAQEEECNCKRGFPFVWGPASSCAGK